jgi:hypothetical protein
MFKMGPYLFLAGSVGEEDKFYEYFFKVWFERWPIDKWARNDSVSVEQLKKMVKEVRSNSFTVAVLTYYLFNRMLLAIIRISCLISIVGRFLRVNGLAAFKLPLTPLARAWTSTLMMTMTLTISYMYPLTRILILAYPSDTSSSVCL